MQLVADRFALLTDGRTIDLATGARVALNITSAGGRAEHARWAVRCDTLQKLHHRFMAPLADYGTIGESQRFEAWRCGPSWRGAPAEAQSALAIASRFLRGCGLTPGRAAIDAARTSVAGAIMVPDETAGYPTGDPEGCGDDPLEDRGLAAVGRSALAPILELFDLTSGSRPFVVSVFGPAGSGKSTLVAQAARAARLNGFVPVAVRLVPRLQLEDDRSLCLLDDDSQGGAWSALLYASMRWPRLHVVIMTASEEMRSVPGIALDRLSPEVLMSAIRPRPMTPSIVRRAGRAAERARGLPGVFAQTLLKTPADRRAPLGPRRRSALSRVAEQRAVYGEEPVADPAEADSTGLAQGHAWPSPGELELLRRRMAGALRLLDEGRHVPGVRQLRQTIGALARRDDWARAGDGAIELARALRARGHARDAQAVLEEARQYCGRAGQEASLIDVTTVYGEAWTDRARLDEAEQSLSAALAAARAANDQTRAATASCALARCLFWRAQFPEAALALPPHGDLGLLPRLRLTATRLAARIAVGRREYGRAMAAATDAVEQARVMGRADAQAVAACTSAFVHLAVGDLDGVARDVGASLSLARAARDPVRAIDARLMLAEADRRRDRRAAATSLVGRIRKVRRSRLPTTLRARCDLVHELLTSSAGPSDVLERQVAATGLGALALYLPDAGAGCLGSRAPDPLTEEIVDIIHACQTAEDETRVLTGVCERIRRHLHAAGVAWIPLGTPSPSAIASDGARVGAGVAGRAGTAGIAIAPHRLEDRIEAAAPVRYGGSIIGALAARWPIACAYDVSRASAVLTTAAAAAAPVMSAAIARRAALPVRPLGDLLGVSSPIIELRRGVERAAAAPFSVLIEGESGSGKELVARAIHRCGGRRDRPFCTLNCAALPDDLIEAELFGHTRGAFTGAVADRAGVFEEAHGGTLFLDEIGELSSRAQAKVLRVIQEGELRRVGENVSRRVDVRLVAATNRDLRQEAAAGRFRVDLLYRLDVVRISVPPLRDRRDDIPVLVEHFWREAADRLSSRATLAAATVVALAGYDWPGNVRELQNILAALAVRCPKRGVVGPAALPPQFAAGQRADTCRLDEARRTFEERFVRAALVRTGGHRTRAAAELGVSRQGLTKLMTRLGLTAG